MRAAAAQVRDITLKEFVAHFSNEYKLEVRWRGPMADAAVAAIAARYWVGWFGMGCMRAAGPYRWSAAALGNCLAAL